jgi:hypothetical protein
MKKIVAAIGLSSLFFQNVSADALKNSLSGMLNKKEETPSMVNLNSLGMRGEPKPVMPKTRSSKAVVATVNGKKIIKKEADRYLSERTRGKVKNFDLLPKKQQLALIKEISLPMLLAERAKKELTDLEKEAVLSSAWMQKTAENSNISDAEIEAVYEKIKAQTKARSPLQQVPPLASLKGRIKKQIVEQQTVEKLMEGVQIRVEPSSETVAGYVGMLALSVDDVNRALNVMTKGKMTWATLPPSEKGRVLQMVAPNKLIALAAKNNLSEKEKETALSNYWMQKSIARIDVDEKAVKKRYQRIKKMTKKSKSRKKLPSFTELEPSLKMQIAQEKFMDQIAKEAKIKLK